MTLYLFKYCLPVLLGYTLFIGLAGRMNPFVKPEYLEERPSWFLGIWTGLSIAAVLGVCMHLAYSISLDSASELLPPTAFFMGVLLLPGFAGYSLYRRRIARELREMPAVPESSALKQRLESDSQWRSEERTSPYLDEAKPVSLDTAESEASFTRDDDQHAPIVASFLDSAELQILDTHGFTAANNEPTESFEAFLGPDFDLSSETSLDDYLDETVFEEFHYSDLDLESAELDATQLVDMSTLGGHANAEPEHYDYSEQELFGNEEAEQLSAFSNEELEQSLQDSLETDFSSDEESLPLYSDYQADVTLGEAADTLTESDKVMEASLNMADNGVIEEQAEDLIDTASEPQPHNLNIIDAPSAMTAVMLEKRLSEELTAHEETSRQLRITRKVLARLTPSAQESTNNLDLEQQDNDSIIQLKEELAESLALQSTHQALANTEMDKRLQAENACAQMQQQLVQAKHDIRRSAAARAKALGTANKAIAFARQTLQVRALLEDELTLARNTLSKRQDTISSVIRELEKEKERTQEEVSHMAQQLVVNEHQLKRHHTLEAANELLDQPLPSTSNGKLPETHQMGPDL